MNNETNQTIFSMQPTVGKSAFESMYGTKDAQVQAADNHLKHTETNRQSESISKVDLHGA